MDIKLLLLDLDDTLLNTQGKLSNRTINAVRDAVEQKTIVAIASGRMHKSLLPYVEKLNTHGPVVSYNGALIKDSLNDNTIYTNPVPLDICKKVLRFAKNNHIYCQMYNELDYFFEQHCDLSDGYHVSTGLKGITLGDNLDTKIIEASPKLLMIDNDIEKVLDIFDKVKDAFEDILYITRSKGHYIEIMNKNVNKGEALLRMCEIYDISPENCMAIGDGLNDLEMIKKAGVGVAVSTASKVLKNAADIVCESADEDGPAKIIEEYILRK